MKEISDEPILIDTKFYEINMNVFLKNQIFLGSHGDLYHRYEAYYKDTDQRIDLGLIHYEDPSHYNIVERPIYSEDYFVVVRKNLATGQIISFEHAFDFKNKTKVYEQTKAKHIYDIIEYQKARKERMQNKKPSTNFVGGANKVFSFLFSGVSR